MTSDVLYLQNPSLSSIFFTLIRKKKGTAELYSGNSLTDEADSHIEMLVLDKTGCLQLPNDF